jgi:hypothetical protein
MTALTRSVLLLGSSLYTHSLTDGSGSVPGMLEARLLKLAPGFDWRCRGEQLFLTHTALDRAFRYVHDFKPHAVVFDLPTYQFTHKAATVRIKRKWPFLYPTLNRVMEGLKFAGGGSFDGRTNIRGGLFRVSRDLSQRVIGAEVEQSWKVSMERATELLDSLLLLEDIAVVCSMPKFYWWEPDPVWCRDQVASARDEMKDYCARHHIPTYDLMRALRERALTPGLAPDGLHLETDTNRVEACLIADCLLRAFM